MNYELYSEHTSDIHAIGRSSRNLMVQDEIP